jgi:hypothetical protein
MVEVGMVGVVVVEEEVGMVGVCTVLLCRTLVHGRTPTTTQPCTTRPRTTCRTGCGMLVW